VQATLAVGGCALVGSFLVMGLDRFDPWFARERGDAVAEYEIVAKENLELLGWSLVALALWDAAANVVKGLALGVNPRQPPTLASGDPNAGRPRRITQ
jgi:hypothetical protein